MINSPNQTASLGWFLSTPSQANFPQLSRSPALASLYNDYSRLVEGLFSDIGVFSDSLYSFTRVALELEVKFKEGFDSEAAERLVKHLKEIALLLRANKKDRNTRSMQLLRKTIASLIVYARDSRDYSFKKQVLEFARDFETAETLESL